MTTTVRRPAQAVDQSNRLLNRQVKGANLHKVIVAQAVINALFEAGAPGGIASVSDCNQWVTHNFKPRDSSLRGVLDSIVATDPRYTSENERFLLALAPFVPKEDEFSDTSIGNVTESLTKPGVPFDLQECYYQVSDRNGVISITEKNLHLIEEIKSAIRRAPYPS